MTPRDYIALALLAALVVLGVWLLVRFLRQRGRAVREEASKHTAAELDGVRAGVLDDKRKQSDGEAWNDFRDNFGPPH